MTKAEIQEFVSYSECCDESFAKCRLIAFNSSRISCTVVLLLLLSASTMAWLALVFVGICVKCSILRMMASLRLQDHPIGFLKSYETVVRSPPPTLLFKPPNWPPLKVYLCFGDNAGKLLAAVMPSSSDAYTPKQWMGKGVEKFILVAMPPPIFSITRLMMVGKSELSS